MFYLCSHNVASKDKYIAFVSTAVETNTPEMELSPGLAILGEVQEKFVFVSDIKAPLADGADDQCFISKGFDATSHFESTIEDVLDMYTRVTGEQLDVSSPIVDNLER